MDSVTEINSSLVGGLSCSFSDTELTDSFNFLNVAFPSKTAIKGTSTVGLKPHPPMWILNSDIHLTEDGKQMNTDESSYIWLSQKVESESVEAQSLVPEIHLPRLSSSKHANHCSAVACQ